MPERILILDDDLDIISICTHILSDLGWEVNARTDCKDIIEAISNIQPSVILMDNCIPDYGGLFAAKQIKSHESFKDIPLIYFSASHDIKNIAAQAGADSYLEKPFKIEDLEKVINSVLQ